MVLVVETGYENSMDKLGCRKAPKEIIKNLPENYFSENNKEIFKDNIKKYILDIERLNEKEGGKVIYNKAKEFYENEDKVIFLGGDHCLSYYSIGAFNEYCLNKGEEAFIIIFDAHADCKNDSNGGNKILNNMNWLRTLIDEGFSSERIILVGLREMDKSESDFLINNNIRQYKMKDLIDYTEICDIIMELANRYFVYISVDIDVVDGAFVSGTARPESGGMTSRQLIYFLQRLNILKGVKGIDITEVNPEIDFRENTVKLASKILGEII